MTAPASGPLGEGMGPSAEAAPGASRILHLTLIRHWFNEIAAGRKTEEYRLLKPYWIKRLMTERPRLPRPFDEIHFRNGYAKGAPFMRVDWLGLVVRLGGQTLPQEYRGQHVFCIQLGRILEIRNYRAPSEPAGLPEPKAEGSRS